MEAWKCAVSLVAVLAASASFAQTSAPQSLPGWGDYMDSLKQLDPIARKAIAQPDDPRSQQESSRILMGTLAQGFIAHVYADPDYPEFISMYNMALNLWAPNPDYMYTWTPVTGTGSYRLRGFRGTSRFVEIYMLGGFYPLTGLYAPYTGSVDLDSLKLGPDGAFDLLISPKKPDGYSGDWYPMDPKTKVMLIRSAAYDWVKERDAVVAIERTDVPAARPRLSAEELSKRMSYLKDWVEKGSVIPWGRVTTLRAEGMINKVKLISYEGVGGARGQSYLEGLYQLADDEALILETEIPKTCRYWSFLTTDDQFATVDFMNRQSSINELHARRDSDGKFRAVISNKDPGVPNWLDAGGYSFGGIQGRWYRCSSTPTPVTRKVRLADLRKYLPKDTPIVSAEQRDAALRERRMGAQLRRKW